MNTPTTHPSDVLPPVHRVIRHPFRLKVGSRIPLNREQAQALAFREINVSEAFTVQDVTGRFFRASLQLLTNRGGEAAIYEEMKRSPEPTLNLTLFCAVLARQRMIQVIQKATELGVTRVQPVISQFSVQPEGLEHEKAHSWPKQALRGARQCRRSSVPEVCPAISFSEALDSPAWNEAAVRVMLDDRAEQSARLFRGPQSGALITGPEGGWSDTERELLEKSGVVPLVLGGRVLRAETAVYAGLTVVQFLLGDMKA